ISWSAHRQGVGPRIDWERNSKERRRHDLVRPDNAKPGDLSDLGSDDHDNSCEQVVEALALRTRKRLSLELAFPLGERGGLSVRAPGGGQLPQVLETLTEVQQCPDSRVDAVTLRKLRAGGRVVLGLHIRPSRVEQRVG